jgi:hypothetical protein
MPGSGRESNDVAMIRSSGVRSAPHAFRNSGDVPARMLCTAVPAGLEAFFAEFGDRVDSRTASPPALTDEEMQARLRRAAERAQDYGMELLPPSG